MKLDEDLTFVDHVIIHCHVDCMKNLAENHISFYYIQGEIKSSDEDSRPSLPIPNAKSLSNVLTF